MLLDAMRCKQAERDARISKSKNVIDEMIDDIKEMKETDLYEQHINFFYDLQKYYPAIMESHNQKMQQHAWAHTSDWIRIGIKQGLFRDDMDIEAMSAYLDTKLWQGFSTIRNDVHRTHLQTIDFMMDCTLRLLTNDKGWEYYQTNKNKIIQPYA